MAKIVVEKNVLRRVNRELNTKYENLQDLRFYIKTMLQSNFIKRLMKLLIQLHI